MLGLAWDGKVDVWGVGCILAELLVGQPIFHGGSVELVLAAHAAVLGPHPKHMLTKSELAHMSAAYHPSSTTSSATAPSSPNPSASRTGTSARTARCTPSSRRASGGRA